MEQQRTSDAQRRRLLDRAMELQDAERARAQGKADDALFRASVAEVGVEARFLEEAERDLARRDAEAAEAAARAAAERSRSRLRLAGAAGGVALVAVVGAVVVAATRPPAPWTEGLDDPAHFALDVSAGTDARVGFADEAGRGKVAVIDVERFAPQADGTYHVNLDGFEVPSSLAGYETVTIDLAGTLPVARLYLEAGDSERWRSPPLQVGPDWQTREVPLASFEHQQRLGERWVSAPTTTPSGLTQLSVKVGHFMNPPEATGELKVDTIGLR